MASIEGRRDSALSALKAQTEEEFLVKIGAKEEEVGEFGVVISFQFLLNVRDSKRSGRISCLVSICLVSIYA